MRIRNFFKEKIAELCDKISNNLRNVDAYEEAEEYEDKKEEYTAEGNYNNNNLREIIPVLTNFNDELEQENMQRKADAERLIEKYSSRLGAIEDKRKQFLSTLDYIGKSPNADEYRLLKDNKTNTLVLFNPNYELNNQQRGTNLYPAVVVVDCTTNEPKAYSTVRDLISSNTKYQSLTKHGEKAYTEKDLSKRFETVGMEVFAEGDVPKTKQTIDQIFDNEAEKLQNAINKQQIVVNRNLYTELENIAKCYPLTDIAYLSPQNQAVLFADNGQSRLVLDFDEGIGLVSAYYRSGIDNSTTKVYDVRDASDGFANLDDRTYQKLISSEPFKNTLDVCGMEMDFENIQEFDYKDNQSFIGTKTYSKNDVGTTEVENTTYIYSSDYNEILEEKMQSRLEEYRKNAPEGVVVEYNKYNNTINLLNNGGQVSITFDELGNRMDLFYKNEFAEINLENGIIIDHKVANDKARDILNNNENFKYITQHLALEPSDIAKGMAGKPLTDKQIEERQKAKEKPNKEKSSKDSKERD